MKKILINKKIVTLTLVLVLLAISSFAFTKSELFQQIAKSQRLINNVYKYLITNYVDDIDIETFTKTSVRNIVSEMDPYTVYLEDDEREGIDLLTSGKYGGIGIQIGKREGKITVIAPMEDTPAQKAGMLSGDIITKIDDKLTKDLTLDETAKMIRGLKGSVLKIHIQRPGDDEELEFVLTRDNIRVKDVAYSGMLDETIGYIRLTRFSTNAVPEMKQAIKKLKHENVESIILDLRDNPGGLLSSAIDILDMFIPKGETLLSTKGRTRESNRVYTAREKPVVPDYVKLAVIINNGSASASEIVAGTIQDLDRGVVIGSRSFGKGLVQTVFGLDDRRSLKVTTAKYYIPSGRLIQKSGYINDDLIVNEIAEDSIFSTIGGRIVKGGGGINPDHLVKGAVTPPLTRECWRRGAFFSYAQKHKHKYNSMDDVYNDFFLLDSFKLYLDEIELDISINGEIQYNEAKSKFMKIDSSRSDLATAFEIIDSFIAENEESLFEKEHTRLSRGLISEFANIFEGINGRYEINLNNDDVIKAAIDILENQMAYNETFTVKSQ